MRGESWSRVQLFSGGESCGPAISSFQHLHFSAASRLFPLASSFLIVGAGFSGAVLARELAERLDARIEIIDQRKHPGGNCHTERDTRSGVMLHKYGPHIFNTSHEDVWKYVNRFGEFRPFANRVKAINARGVFSFPINLHTINQFFGKTFSPDEARAFIASRADSSIGTPSNFEEQALKFVGRDLYEAFFYGYTKKHWGCEPRELPASILKRLPLRFNYDDNYYNSRYQAIPVEGYSSVIERIVDHPNIRVVLNTRWERAMAAGFDHVFYSGPLDELVGFPKGRLGYRTIHFERIDAEGDFQGNAVLNYTGGETPWTRIHEHKHFAPWERLERTVAFREFAKETAPSDIPYYPKRLAADMDLLRSYEKQLAESPNITPLGRLGTYRYLDMDQVIGEALDLAADIVAALGNKRPIPQRIRSREK